MQSVSQSINCSIYRWRLCSSILRKKLVPFVTRFLSVALTGHQETVSRCRRKSLDKKRATDAADDLLLLCLIFWALAVASVGRSSAATWKRENMYDIIYVYVYNMSTKVFQCMTCVRDARRTAKRILRFEIGISSLMLATNGKIRSATAHE